MEIYYKGTFADMTSYMGNPPIQYSIGPVFNGTEKYGIFAFNDKYSLKRFAFRYHKILGANGPELGPEHKAPVRYFEVTGDLAEIDKEVMASLKREYPTAVALKNVVFLQELSYNDL